MISAGYAGPREVSYLFIDGAYLDQIIETFSNEYFGGLNFRINPDAIARGFTKTFYYNCLPVQWAGETDEAFGVRLEEKRSRFEKLQQARGWHVQEGIVKRKGKRLTQKEVDVLITVDILTHAYRRNMHSMTFIAGDQDFRPLLEALIRDGMFVTLLSERTSVSRDLLHMADEFRKIDLYMAFDWLERNIDDGIILPERSYNFPRLTNPGARVEYGTTELNENVTIFKNDKSYLAITEDLRSKTHRHELVHDNLRLLKAVHANEFGAVVWENLTK